MQAEISIYEKCKTLKDALDIQIQVGKEVSSFFTKNEALLIKKIDDKSVFFQFLKENMPLFPPAVNLDKKEELRYNRAYIFSIYYNTELLAYKYDYKPYVIESNLGNFDEAKEAYDNTVEGIPDGKHRFILSGIEEGRLKLKQAPYRVLESGYFEVKNGKVQIDSIVEQLSFAYLFFNNHTFLEDIVPINDTLYELVFGS